jgi:hypothetical protein
VARGEKFISPRCSICSRRRVAHSSSTSCSAVIHGVLNWMTPSSHLRASSCPLNVKTLSPSAMVPVEHSFSRVMSLFKCVTLKQVNPGGILVDL